MAKNNNRKRIGLIFSYNENWIAGSYYILNLIQALNTLEDANKPILYIFCGSAKEMNVIKTITYPYVHYQFINNTGYNSGLYTFWQRLINKISLLITKKLVFDERPNQLDFCFPNPEGYFFEKTDKTKKWYWIPDFQEDYLPHFFSQEEVNSRKTTQKTWVANQYNLIVSSQDSLTDFKRLYANAENKIAVMPFAVTHPSYIELNIDELREKYAIPQQYFFAPNQFWIHKNQQIILGAVKLLKDKGIEVFVAFSGKETDYRNPNYFASLQQYVEKNNLSKNIKFLGFIDRKEQLKLMAEALAIVQPSLFEGWSTVVEDAKTMNQFVILSDLRVHHEQISDNVMFFDPKNAVALAEHLQTVWEKSTTKIQIDYSKNVRQFAEHFMNIVESGNKK